ncbi:aspartic peptidase domain-containing protein [Trametes gibbosa]|nr:aspartic peptidase domain-containing protein [Trametes gibbosa]
MAWWPTFILLLAAKLAGDLGYDGGVHAISVPIEGQRRPGKWWQSVGGVVPSQRRRGMDGIVDLQNAGDLQYYTNITLEGKQFRVLIDSGSADLWVAGDVPGSEHTSHNATIKYSDGVVSGQIRTATLGLQGFNITKQAYIHQPVTENYTENSGILGLGPSRLSSVLAALGGPAGDPPLDRLFRQTTSLPSFISILLGRSDDPDSAVPGQLTIGEVLPDYSDVTLSPSLPIERVDWNQHWMVALDKGGIIGPDGQAIKASEDKQLKVIFDSGYTLPQVPKAVADAIYSRVPGAKYVTISATETPIWTMPCDVELNITFKFAGVAYPIHPLDTVMDDLHGPLDSTGKPSCVGSFQPISTKQPYDIVLGMAFLRNAYILMNFGDFVDGSQTQVGDPFVKLLALTDPAEAHEDFVQQRLGGIDTTGQQTLLPPPPQEVNTVVAETASQKLRPFLPYIIVASIIGGLLLLFAVAYFFIWRSGRKYQRLNAPAPAGLEEGRSPSPSDEKMFENVFEEKVTPDPWAVDAGTLPHKVDPEALTASVLPPPVTRESTTALTDGLLPLTATSAFSYDSAGEAVLVLSDPTLPERYTDSPESASPPAVNETLPPAHETKPLPVEETQTLLAPPQPLPASVRDNSEIPAHPLVIRKKTRPLPDPRTYSGSTTPTSRVADVFDVSRGPTPAVYTLPAFQDSSRPAVELAPSRPGSVRPLPSPSSST